jgi:hypothetical protein
MPRTSVRTIFEPGHRCANVQFRGKTPNEQVTSTLKLLTRIRIDRTPLRLGNEPNRAMVVNVTSNATRYWPCLVQWMVWARSIDRTASFSRRSPKRYQAHSPAARMPAAVARSFTPVAISVQDAMMMTHGDRIVRLSPNGAAAEPRAQQQPGLRMGPSAPAG